MKNTERRTQLYLRADQHEAVLWLAERRQTSMAQVVRDALDAYLATTPGTPRRAGTDPLADLVGIFDGPGDLSENHDAYVYGSALPERSKRARGRRAKRRP